VRALGVAVKDVGLVERGRSAVGQEPGARRLDLGDRADGGDLDAELFCGAGEILVG
jgi:hypothetical protein